MNDMLNDSKRLTRSIVVIGAILAIVSIFYLLSHVFSFDFSFQLNFSLDELLLLLFLFLIIISLLVIRIFLLEAKYKAKQNQYNHLVENLPHCIFVKTPQSVYESCNSSYAQLLGIISSEIRGKTDFDFYPENLANIYRSNDRDVIAGKKVLQFENPVKINGKDLMVRTVKIPVVNQEGKVEKLLGIFWDITDTKKALQLLDESQRKLSTLISTLPGAAYSFKTDETRTVEYISNGVEYITGYGADYFSLSEGFGWNQLIFREDLSGTLQRIDRALSNNEPYQIVYRILNSWNDVRWVMDSGCGVAGQDGKIIKTEGFLIDITDRHNAEELVRRMNTDLEARVEERTQKLQKMYQALRVSENQFRKAFETAMQGLALIGVDGSFIKANLALCDFLGYQEKELLKRNLFSITYPGDLEEDKMYMAQLINGAIQSHQCEKRLYHKEGLIAWVLQSMTLVRDYDESPMHFVMQFIDITERKQTEEQLKKYSETLTVLLREVNHRVKNNLAALIGMLHMEHDRALDAGKKEYTTFLNDIISRISSLSTVHSMLSAQNWQPLDIKKLCTHVIRGAIQGTAPTKNVHIKISSPLIKLNSNLSHHLTLVINELTTNAVKHAMVGREEAYLTLTISNEEDYIRMIFKDDGPGFPEDMIRGDYSRGNIGFELIRGIVLQSLQGEFYLENNNGATAIIRFPNEAD